MLQKVQLTQTTASQDYSDQDPEIGGKWGIRGSSSNEESAYPGRWLPSRALGQLELICTRRLLSACYSLWRPKRTRNRQKCERSALHGREKWEHKH